jgi:hypothetical protein
VGGVSRRGRVLNCFGTFPELIPGAFPVCPSSTPGSSSPLLQLLTESSPPLLMQTPKGTTPVTMSNPVSDLGIYAQVRPIDVHSPCKVNLDVLTLTVARSPVRWPV